MLHERLNKRRLNSRVWVRSTLGLAVVVLLSSAHLSAARAGDGDDDSFMAKFMTTLGLQRGGDDGINYSERSPLVVPSTHDLPPPVAAGAPKSADWPKDPDVRRRAASKTKKKVSNSTYDLTEDSRPLMPHELEAGRQRGADEGKPGIDSEAAMSQSSQSQLGNSGKNGLFKFNWFKKEEYGTFTGEPVRADLTDPPVGYRTPSADQPYGIGPDKAKTKSKGIGERMETETGR
jgi:hypothetical protein